MTARRQLVHTVRIRLTRRWRLAATLAMAVAGAGGIAVPTAASAGSTATPASVVAGGRGSSGADYLSLGDSVTFGYRESTTTPPPNYADAASFVGYPEVVGAALGLNVANPSCPGETSASLIDKSAPNNGCESQPNGGPGYRSGFPLHVNYSGSQLQYAVQYLRSHPHTRLVSLMIGANDSFLCQETTADQCTKELPAVERHISLDVARTLWAVRTLGRYHGQIVILNYYSLDYSNPTDNAGSQALNAAMDNGARPFGVTIADGFGVLQAAAQQSGGNTCKAGLLTQLSTGGCGIHPSLAGQALLALAVEVAVQRR